ncbi:Maf family protein [Psychrosphaera aestuarii]|uniref:Maf family protein n=1 Tax=Psychrosphaera aestuarii TaxID=1266052 RepID=UPI001B319373|nr:nucleoside triphosphate pyrophosphatase [Psychrosphaera aestuarii]
MSNKETRTIILGSTSPFRKEILSKLNLSFLTDKPEVDETPLNNETPEELVARLALLKAQAVAARHKDSIVIGSDQVAVFNDEILGKPHTHENAVAQLTKFSGQTVTFLTGLSVIDTNSGITNTIVEPFKVSFKNLTAEMIEFYLRAETPYNCAGSFKSEALGICLFDKLQGDDPNSLVGLPLIKLVSLLEKIDYSVLKQQNKS